MVITEGYGVAVVVAPLRLQGRIVGAAVGGYALTNLAQSAAIEGLARQTSIPFKPMWELARQEQPLPSRRLILHGEVSPWRFWAMVGASLASPDPRNIGAFALGARA